MRNFIYILLALVIISCQENLELEGEWKRTEYIDEEEIPQVISAELGVPLSNDLRIEIIKDSMTFSQENKTRSVQLKLDGDYILFPDNKNEYEMKWKVIEYDDKHLLIERNIGGIDPFYIKMKFKKE